MTVGSPLAPASSGPWPVPELDDVQAPVADPAPPSARPVRPDPAPARRLPPLVVPSGPVLGDRARPVVLVLVVLATSVFIGHVAGAQGRTLVHDRMLPWILGRSLGVATYVALSAMVVLGLWLRHPWRARFRRPRPESILWAHVSLAACTVALLIGHLTSLALDQYAGVGWTGVFVPWGAHLKPTGIALGTLAFYLLLLVVGTAALAGSIGRAMWFPVHTASVVVFCLTLAHGVLSGSDSVALRWLYVCSGFVVLLLQFTRWLAGTLEHGTPVVDG